MKQRIKMIPGLFLVLLIFVIQCQNIETKVASGKVVHFQTNRNRVIIPLSVNDSKPLNIILDTGMRFDGVYLFHESFLDMINTADAIEVRVPGAGAGEASTALMIETGQLKFGDVVIDSQRVIISRSAHTQGFPTDGVIGWNLFGHYTVEINYDDEIITLHDTAGYEAGAGWKELPVRLKDGMPFFICDVEINEGEIVPLECYIDLASGDALELLTGPDQKFTMPDNLEDSYLGTGLSGDIHGQVGRVRKFTIAGYDISDIPAAFVKGDVRSKQDSGECILGNNLIRRFNIIFDYHRSRLLLKPGKHFDKPFE